MRDRKTPRERRLARETRGEGVPQRQRKAGRASSEQRAHPQRGDEPGDPRLINRRRDARDPEGT